MSAPRRPKPAGPVGAIVRAFLLELAGTVQDDKFPRDGRFLEWSEGSRRTRGKIVGEFFETNKLAARTLKINPDAAEHARQLLLASTFVEIRYYAENPGPQVWIAVWVGI